MGKYADYGRELHTLPHRDDLNTNDSLLFYQDGEYKQLELNKIQALQAGIELNVTAPEGSVISVSNGTETFSKTGGTVQFSLAGVGTYTVSATKDGMTASETLVVDSIRVYNVILKYYHIYGISRDQNSSSPEWIRTDEAIGFEAVASVGNTTVGHSDFDDKYPWGDMKRHIMSTGDVMVYIPEFWYKRVVDENGIETIQIATAPVDEFTKHPGSGRYFSAYQSNENSITSQSEVQIAQSGGVTGLRSSVRNNKSDGWQVLDIATYQAVIMLFLVEYATYDEQSAIGKGWVNQSGWPTTGRCDNMQYLTGREAGTDGQTQVVYRGVEAPWGSNIAIDGINIQNGVDYYVCTDPSNFATDTATNYTKLSYSNNVGYTRGLQYYIKKLGYDPDNSWCMFPVVGNGGSATTYCCDACSGESAYASNGWTSPIYSGYYGAGDTGGFFCVWHGTASYGWSHCLLRIMYVPSLDTNNSTTVTGEWTYSN